METKVKQLGNRKNEISAMDLLSPDPRLLTLSSWHQIADKLPEFKRELMRRQMYITWYRS